MDLIVSKGERQEEVRLERRPDGLWDVAVGEKRYTVDVANAGSLLSLRLADGASAGRQFEIAVRRVSNRGHSVYQVSSTGGTDTVTVTDPLTHLLEQVSPERAGGGVVSAMMPGRVVEVLLEEGAEVEQGQGVVVVEAMKMKNEIQAEATGSLVKVHVEAGQNVESGDPLFEIA